MIQETTREFGHRLQMAVEAHPLAPPTPFGRQRWLLDRLAKEAGLEVSPNTMHKWFGGMSRPREDNITKLAKVLNVDVIWLALGRTPTAESKASPQDVQRASGAVLVLAGLIEVNGGKVMFAGDDEPGVDLWVRQGGRRVSVSVAMQKNAGKNCSFLITEPAAEKIVSVSVTPNAGSSARVDIIDLTDVERQNLGGYSIISGEARDGGKIKVASQRNLLAPMTDLAGLLD